MVENASLDAESASVRTHVTVMQGVIQRMAEKSRSCKVWCITIVAAILVLLSRTESPDYALIAFIPATLFLVLDTYYLSLEQRFRNSYNEFVGALHKGELLESDLYVVRPSGPIPRHFWRSLRSFSIWPFYILLGCMILIVWQFVII